MVRALKFALITDAFPPLRTSSAVQLRDLSREFANQGHLLTVMVSTPDLAKAWELEELEGFRVLRLRAPRTKDIAYVRRTLAELFMPFFMLYQLRKTPLSNERWDGIIWYAPSIFHGPLAKALKKGSTCKGYLVVRDIFPDWAVDMELMNRGGLPHRFFDAIARYQYSVANVIGVQTPGNLTYFENWKQKPERKLEVLHNWLAAPATRKCSIRLSETRLAERQVFVYAGNMGVAQGLDILLDLAANFRNDKKIGFLFVGRGSEVGRLKDVVVQRQLENVIFFDEIDPDEIPDLYQQCTVGLLALDPRHKSHNIPGKFLTYMQSGLPVLANINAGNDLAQLIRSEQVGQVCESNQVSDLIELANRLLEEISSDEALSGRCKNLFERQFSVKRAVKQIAQALV